MTDQTISAYLSANAKYIGEDSAVAISTLSDAVWPAILAALDELNGGATEPGIDCSVAITHETLADFDNSRVNYWSEKGSRKVIDCAGLSAILYKRLQLSKGAERVEMVVVDLGDRRVALT